MIEVVAKRHGRFAAHALRVAAVASFLFIAWWAFLGIPEFALEKYAPYKYISHSVALPRMAEPIDSALDRARRLPGIQRIDCSPTELTKEKFSFKPAVVLDCFMVQNMDGQWTSFDVFSPERGWPVQRAYGNFRAGATFWTYPLDFPFAQSLLQLLFALVLAWGALRGELGRLLPAICRQPAWVLLPPALVVAYKGMFWLRTGQLNIGGGCIAAKYSDSMMWLYPVLVAAIGEELIYRGWGFRLLERAGWSSGWILSITSIAFALMHAGNFYGPQAVVYYFGMAFAYGLLRATTGSILLCILAHALSNLVATVVCGNLGG